SKRHSHLKYAKGLHHFQIFERRGGLSSKTLQGIFSECINTDMPVGCKFAVVSSKRDIGSAEIQCIIFEVAHHLHIIAVVAIHAFTDLMPKRHDVDRMILVLPETFYHSLDIGFP